MDTRNKKVVFIDISSGVFDRHLTSFLYFLTTHGYSVYIRPSVRVRISFARNLYTKLMLDLEGVSLRYFKPADMDIFISDRRGRGAIRISADYFTPRSESSFHVPIAMHPQLYTHGLYEKCAELRGNSERNIRIFFAGNFDRNYYGNTYIRPLFGKFTRLELYDIVLEDLKHILRLPVSKKELYAEGNRDLIIVDNAHFRIPMEELLEILARSEFFLAFSGVHKPLCHNVVEAMALGCIPILEYPEMLHPPLESGINCLSFSGRESFLTVIRQALALDAQKLEKMRKAALAYYREHLSPSAVVRDFESRLPGLRTIYINSGITVRLLRRREGV
jgi:glycosyltransferase involved in cell wall biosynthesis